MRWRSATTCNLIRIWVAKYEHGAFEDDVRAADLLQEYETKIAALERLVGRQALEIEFLRGPREAHRGREARLHPSWPAWLHSALGYLSPRNSRITTSGRGLKPPRDPVRLLGAHSNK